jgi:putative OPT family oligopeptide transporter
MAEDLMEEKNGPAGKLDANAYRELAPDEIYRPLVPAEKTLYEVTLRSVLTGLIMAVIFSLASAYLALKTGQGMEAAIPIAILAVAMARLFPRRSTILENVIIQSIGAASAAVVAGAVFTIPALYMLGLEVSFHHIFLTAFFGGCLGILFLIPMRWYLMSKEHGKLRFPEAMATTEILVAGESEGTQARILVWSAVFAFIYDFFILFFEAWREIITFRSVWVGRWLEERFLMAFRIDNLAAVVGLGFIVGLKYAAIICSGSLLSYLVLVPLVYHIGHHFGGIIPPGTIPIADMGVNEIFENYVRIIGIGGIAGAGMIGILRTLPSIAGSFAEGFKGMAASHRKEEARTEKNINLSVVLLLILLTGAALLLFFGGALTTFRIAFWSVLTVMIIAFLFTMVAARAIGLIGTNPVSGMTLVTLIITSVVLVHLGLKSETGMFVALVVGGVVCTALAVAGAFATDLKIGYWIGATPRHQQRWKFLGVTISAASCALAMMLLNRVYVFGTENFPAPQASAMKEIIVGLMGAESSVQWLLFALGVIIAVILETCRVPSLAFALGMYLPIQLNTAVLAGGIVSHFVNRKGKEAGERGVLVASGYIAGGSIAGVVAAAFIAMNVTWTFPYSDHAMDSAGEIVSILFFALLCIFMYRYALGRKKTV